MKMIAMELNIEELINWLKKFRKPIAKLVSKFSLEDEAHENSSLTPPT